MRRVKAQGKRNGSSIFPAARLPQRGTDGERLKNKTLRKKMTLNDSVLKRWIMDLLWLGREGEIKGERQRKVYFPVDRCSPMSK